MEEQLSRFGRERSDSQNRQSSMAQMIQGEQSQLSTLNKVLNNKISPNKNIFSNPTSPKHIDNSGEYRENTFGVNELGRYLLNS